MAFPWIIKRIFEDNGAGPHIDWDACPFRVTEDEELDDIIGDEDEEEDP
jgi:hypothetical protein